MILTLRSDGVPCPVTGSFRAAEWFALALAGLSHTGNVGIVALQRAIVRLAPGEETGPWKVLLAAVAVRS